jgi:hypothetical protein
MTESRLVTLLIDEKTVERILTQINERTPKRGKSADGLSAEKIPVFVAGLRHLYDTVLLEQPLTSRKLRNELDNSLQPILKHASALRDQVSDDRFLEISKPLEAAALSLHIRKSNNDRGKYLSAFDAAALTVDALYKLESVVKHLYMIIDDFDKLDPVERSVWLIGGESEREIYIRQTLFSYMSKNEHSGIDIWILERIAELYETLFGEHFSPIDRKKKPGYKAGSARFRGRSVRFAFAIIEELRLSSLFAPLKKEELSLRPGDSIEHYDLKALNRDHALAGSSTNPLRVSNRIGDIWTERKKRERAKQAASNTLQDQSAETSDSISRVASPRS